MTRKDLADRQSLGAPLVERLRQLAKSALSPYLDDAADRIEQLERVIAQHNLCHDLHGKVGCEDFANGCAAEITRIYGRCPWQEEIYRLHDRIKSLIGRAESAEALADAARSKAHGHSSPASVGGVPNAEATAWIPVSERLPELHQPIALLSVRRWENCAFDRNVQGAGYLEDYGSGPFWSTLRASETLDSYTHWMPLPAPPVVDADRESASQESKPNEQASASPPKDTQR